MKQYFSPWIALGVGLVLTIVVSLEVKKDLEYDVAYEFAFTSDQITLKIQERLDAYAHLLKGGASLFAASSVVNRREWQAYVERLGAQSSVTGVQGIGFSQVILPHQLAAHIASVRAEGFSDYTVRPAGERAIYTSIIYLEPFRDRNLRALGYDMFSEPVRRAAMELARDSGAPALSGKVKLVQETETDAQAGVLMYVPVYRNGAPTDTVEQRRTALIGWTYSPYRMKDLLDGILANWNDQKIKRVDLQIYAGHDVKADSLLYSSHPASTHKIDPLSYQRRDIVFNGQHWLLEFHAVEGVTTISYVSVWVTLAGGILLSSLLCGLMLVLARTQVRGREVADTLTAELRLSVDSLKESEAALQLFTRDFEAFLDQVTDFVYFKGADSRIKFCSQTLANITGHRNWRDMVGKHDREIFPPDTAKIYEEEEAAVSAEGRPLVNKINHYYEKEGRAGYVETNKWPLFDADGKVVGIFGISRDVTERKRTEDALRQSEERIRNMIDAAGAYLWEIDTNMVYTYASGQSMFVKGHQPEALLGHTPMDFMLPEDIAPVAEIVNRAIADKSPFRLQHRDITPSGEVWWEEVYGAVFCDAEGKVIGLRGTGMGINARKQAENALRHEKQFSVDTLNALPGVFYMFDATGRFVRWNHQFSKVTGYADTELETMQATDFFAGDEQGRVGEAIQRVFAEGQASIDVDFQTKDGQKLPYHFTGQSSTIGEQTYLLGIGIDVSAQRQMQQALQIERTHLQTLLSSIPDMIWLKDADGIYLSCNPEFERFFGARESNIVGKTDYDFVPKELADAFRKNDLAAIANNKLTINEEWVVYANDGRSILLETSKMPMYMSDGQLIGVMGIGHDITERNAHQQKLEQIAHFDNLTGLPNRALLLDRLHQAMTQTLRRETMLAVTFLDLDGFKLINDQYGHGAGDHLLTKLADHMKLALREGDTLARIGGDEFVAVILDLPDVESSVPMISRLLAAAAEVVYFEGNPLRVSASLGVTFYPQTEAIDADQLMRQADQAMYQAKQAGKNRYHIFDTVHAHSVRDHHESLDRIKQALDAQEFVLYYQPKVNMRTGVVIGAEALIRWQHPERGLLPPAAFLPLITDHPLAIEFGEWVLDAAMTQIETWKATGLPLQVSVNIDAIHLEQTDFVDHLRQALLAHPTLVAGDLELEVLETSALHDITYVSSVIYACSEMGVGFALDDFGTGYSSLTYLKRLPAGLLKIDQSFVRNMLDDPDDLAILDGVLGLANAFRRLAIAEGVETLQHGVLLLQLGCELAQGYAIARPMPAEDMPAWLAAWRPDPSWMNRALVSRDDMPVLFAGVEHRAWILKVARFIRGEGDTPPPMHHEHCRVGQWLKSELRLRKGNQRAIQVLGPLHVEIHELANNLIRLKQDGQMDAAIARLTELYQLRDRLLLQFVEMLR